MSTQTQEPVEMATRPVPEHRWLQQLVGEWRVETEMTMGPGGPKQKSEGTESVKSLGGLWAFTEGNAAMPDGTLPAPGGWNRFQLEVADLEELVAQLRDAGARFRNEVVTGVGGKQILVEDPSGNPVELFEPTLPEASLSSSD